MAASTTPAATAARNGKPAATGTPVQLGEGMVAQITNGKLIIAVDLANRGGPSSTGKTIVVASSHGARGIAGTDVKININAYVANPNFTG